MLKSFIIFLKGICLVQSEKIKYSIVCFKDNNPNEVGNYWSTKLQVPIQKFGKIVHIPVQGKGTYKRISQYGVCTVTVCNVKLKHWLMNEIQSMPG